MRRARQQQRLTRPSRPASRSSRSSPAGIYSAEAFDAANTIIDELKILSSGKGGTKNITRAERSSTGLHRINFVGLTKTISFKANGNIAGSAVYVNEVQERAIVQLGLE